MIKILHIGIHASGGAGIAMLRLHEEFLKLKINSKVLCWDRNEPEKEIYKYYYPGPPTFSEKIHNRINNPADKLIKAKKELEQTGGNYEAFSFPYSLNRVEFHPLVLEADIIHLHWIGSEINYNSFFRIKKPIVWTLHDMNPFLGGFHYIGDVARNEQLASLENLIRTHKEKALAKAHNLTIVTPSKWLKDISSRSKAFIKRNHFHIFNGVEIIKDENALLKFKKDRGIEKDDLVLTFISDTVTNPRKGFDILLQSLKLLKATHTQRIKVLAIGNLNSIENTEIIALGYIKNINEIYTVLGATDFFLLPSLEDNLPNVMLESLVNGAPVIGFKTGGIPEVISNGINGFICEDLTSEALAKVLNTAINHPSLPRETIAKMAREKFHINIMANEYLTLYNKIT